MWRIICDLDRFRGGLQRTPEGVGRHSCVSLRNFGKLRAQTGGSLARSWKDVRGRPSGLGDLAIVLGGLQLSEGALDKIFSATWPSVD